MRRFVSKALQKFDKLDAGQVKRLILALSQDNEVLEMVLDSMTDGVLVLDTSHKLVLANKAAERQIPFSTSDPYDKLIWSVIPDREVADFLRAKLESEDSVADKEFSFESAGSVRTYEYSLMPLVNKGAIQGTLIHVEEVTEKRSKEARLRRAESLASLTTLAAGVAHEIKNPLGSIGIHIQLIQKAMGRGEVNTDSIHDHLDIVNEEIERLNGIIVDFLFAVRPMDTDLKEQDLNAVVRDVLDFVTVECEEAQVEVVDLLDDELPEVALDEKYVKQALLNIVKNALGAMPKGGQLTVRTRADDDQVVLSVADNGEGIPEENLAKIFEPYFTTKEFGSGLGLTVVYKIIKEHGGDISLTTKEGAGTTFHMAFPIPLREQKLLGWSED